jgi:hypothetical protein
MSLIEAFEKSATAAAATVERVARTPDQIAAAVARVAPAGPLAVAARLSNSSQSRKQPLPFERNANKNDVQIYPRIEFCDVCI